MPRISRRSSFLLVLLLALPCGAFDEPTPQGATIFGRIIDEAGTSVPARCPFRFTEPIPEESVPILPGANDGFDLDAEGRFERDLVPTGVAFEISIPIVEELRHSVAVRPLAEGERLDLGTIILPPTAVISGRVVDDRGEPVPDAVVRITSSKSAAIWRSNYAETDLSGEFRVRGVRGECFCLSVESSGHEALRDLVRGRGALADLAGGEDLRVEDIVVGRRAVRTVRIHLDDGPIPEWTRIVATLEALPEGPQWESWGDRNGVIELPGIPARAVRLTVHCDGHPLRTILAESVENLPELVTFARGGSLEVRFVVPPGGEPPSGMLDIRTISGRYARRFAKVDGEGIARFDDLPVDAPAFRLFFRDGSSRIIDGVRLSRDAVAQCVLELEPARVHTILVRDDAGPLAGATVVLDGADHGGSGVTDADGRVSIEVEGELLGAWLITRAGVPGRELSLAPHADGTYRPVPRPTGKVRIEVSDPEGMPVSGEDVFLSTAGFSESGVTDAAGVAEFGAVPPGTIRAECAGRSAELILAADESAASRLVVPALRSIAGTVTIEGSPARSGGVWAPHGHAEIRPNGTFELRTRAEGEIPLSVQTTSRFRDAPGFLECRVNFIARSAHVPGCGGSLTFPPWTVPAGAERVELDLDLVDLRGRVVDREGRPLANARVSPCSLFPTSEDPSEWTDAEGRFLLAGLAPGEHAFWIDGVRMETLVLDQDREVEWTFPPPTEPRTLRVLGAEPGAGIHVMLPAGEFVAERRAGEVAIEVPAGERWLVVTADVPRAPPRLGATIAVGEAASEPIEVVLARGRVIDPWIAGCHESGWPLRVRRLETGGERSAEGGLDLELVRGRCRIFLPDGPYRIECDSPDGRTYAAEIVIDAEGSLPKSAMELLPE